MNLDKVAFSNIPSLQLQNNNSGVKCEKKN